ncbi:cyclic nucleotide-binding-like protein [Polychytrium aggregatum]|uniref:cyclic nucleotide-binding-like protein n=1 Tax=Polychytrium aggregatum TaxID=110093 RepID=UPI0022FE827B|nr:cyclic nucleotide-binding-like protein [Polychytrium aggregatum]KAI9209214.1 cyclic nucleotide-binding-like protein [Polychytrium aggregatum]
MKGDEEAGFVQRPSVRSSAWRPQQSSSTSPGDGSNPGSLKREKLDPAKEAQAHLQNAIDMQIDTSKLPRHPFQFIIPMNSVAVLWWAYGINLIHLFNIITIPVYLAWPVGSNILQIIYFFLGIDCIMMMDCLVQSRVTFKNDYGVYVRWEPCAARCPSALLAIPKSPHNLVLCLLWASSTLMQYPIRGLSQPITRLVKTMVILMIMGHIDGCLFWTIDNLLIPGNRWIDRNNLLFDTNGNIVPQSTQYLTSYLSALRSLVLKLRDTELDTENIYVIFEFVAGILAYGTVFGNIHSIVEMLDHTAASTKAEERHKFEMAWLRKYMREKGLLPDIQKMVTAHKALQWRRSQGMDEAHLFDDIPKSVQQEIKNFLYLDLVQSVPIFQETDMQFKNSVTFKMKPLLVLDNWFVFRKGDDGNEMYFIKKGRVQIVGDTGQIFCTLNAGSFFGEIALFEDCKRTASAKAMGDVELCVLTKEDFNEVLRQNEIVAEHIRTTIAQRKENEAKKKVEAESAVRDRNRSASIFKRSVNSIRIGTHSLSGLYKSSKEVFTKSFGMLDEEDS